MLKPPKECNVFGGFSFASPSSNQRLATRADSTSHPLTYYDANGQRAKRNTVTDTIVYIGSHYEKRFPLHDLNDDCLVNVVDIMLVVACWNTSVGDPDYNPTYDLDGDGDIDIADIMMVAGHWRETCTTVKYYSLGGQRVAMREGNTLYYLFSNHLGSTSVAYNTRNDTWTTQRYYPYGSNRSGEVPTDRLFTGQLFDGTIGLYDYGARFYDPYLGRFISADPLVPRPRNPQAWNRYSYCLNNPLKYTDPSGHDGEAAAGVAILILELADPLPLDPLVIPAAVNLIVSDPWVQQTLSWVSMHSDKLSAVADRLFRFAQDVGGRIQQAFQGGEAASSGGLDPNDPWRWGQNYRANYEQFFDVTPDPNYEVHHVLPQRFREILAEASQGRINVDDPRWLREILIQEPATDVRIHQRLYTDVWQTWAAELGRVPTAHEIVQFARQLEEQYLIEGTLFYREGANLPSLVDWNTLQILLQGGP